MFYLLLARQLKCHFILSTRPLRCARFVHLTMPAAKRKISGGDLPAQPLKRRASARTAATATLANPDRNSEVIDAPGALRASPDGNVDERIVSGLLGGPRNGDKADSPLSDVPETLEPPQNNGGAKAAVAQRVNSAQVATSAKKRKVKNKNGDGTASTDLCAAEQEPNKNTTIDPGDPEADGDEAADPEELKVALSRPPPVNSDYLPLPWKGRLGYCCLNTYLRNSNPPIVRTRVSTI